VPKGHPFDVAELRDTILTELDRRRPAAASIRALCRVTGARSTQTVHTHLAALIDLELVVLGERGRGYRLAPCTDWNAESCQNCGTCSCPRDERRDLLNDGVEWPGCDLHWLGGRHAIGQRG
jgi:hypothetical protein